MINLIQATETVPISILTTTPEEFPYFAFDDDAAGIEWRHTPVPGEDAYELVIVRKKDWSKQGTFFAQPEKDEYRTNDLFVRHPTKPMLWRAIGMLDRLLDGGSEANLCL